MTQVLVVTSAKRFKEQLYTQVIAVLSAKKLGVEGQTETHILVLLSANVCG